MKKFNALVTYDFCVKLYQTNVNFGAMCIMVTKDKLNDCTVGAMNSRDTVLKEELQNG